MSNGKITYGGFLSAIFIVIATIVVSSGASSKMTTVTGLFGNSRPDSLLVCIPDIRYYKTSAVKGGNVTVRIPKCLYSQASFYPSGMPNVFFISDGTSLTIDLSTIGKLKVTSNKPGSSIDQRRRAYFDWNNEQCRKAIADKAPLGEEYKAQATKWILDNKDNVIALDAINGLKAWTTQEELQPLINNLSPKLLQTKQARLVLGEYCH
jgi:hypothetical protein